MSDGYEQKRLVIAEGFGEDLIFDEGEMPTQGYNYHTHIATLELKLWPELLAEGIPLRISVSEQIRWIAHGSVERWQHADGSWDEDVYEDGGPWRQDGTSVEYHLVSVNVDTLIATFSTEEVSVVTLKGTQ